MSTDPWVWLSALLTLCIFSFLYKDNPFFKFAEHLFTGLSVGYTIAASWFLVIKPNIIQNIFVAKDWVLLIPLAIGLLLKSHSPDTAAHWQPVMNKISSLAILILLVVGLGLNASNIISLIGSGGLLALLLFIIGCLAIGLVLGGRDQGVRSVMGLGTAQRNVSAAILVSVQNFSGTNTVSFVLVAAVLLLLILLPTSKRMGARVQGASPAAPPTQPAA